MKDLVFKESSWGTNWKQNGRGARAPGAPVLPTPMFCI